jgi:hypothetical protein
MGYDNFFERPTHLFITIGIYTSCHADKNASL